jgi:hypothetical protein
MYGTLPSLAANQPTINSNGPGDASLCGAELQLPLLLYTTVAGVKASTRAIKHVSRVFLSLTAATMNSVTTLKVFYYLVYGLMQDARGSSYRLAPPSEFSYLNVGGGADAVGADTCKAMWTEFTGALSTCGTVRVFDWILHSRLQASRESTFLPINTVNYIATLKVLTPHSMTTYTRS